MFFGSNDVASNIFFLFVSIAGIAFAFLFLAGLFVLAGDPDHGWRPAKKLLVGLTTVVLLAWVACICIFFVAALLSVFGINL